MRKIISLSRLAAFAAIMLDCPAVWPGYGQSADDGFNPNIRGSVYAVAVQADGKVIVGGQFNEVGGVPRTNLVRLNIDGSVDAGFNPGASEDSCPGCGAVYRLAIQPDRKILVGGRFAMVAGEPRTNLARLNANGSVDTDFTAGASGGYELHTAIYLSAVSALAVQPDGKILVGGIFTNLGGLPRMNIGRLHANGTVDLGFNPDADHRVRELTLQPDGQILVGGDFKFVGGLPRSNIGRLRADGSVDEFFNPGVGGGAAGCFGQTWISSLMVQPDGKILAGGLFCKIGGQWHRSIARLNSDGSADTAFDSGDTGLAISNAPVVLALQPDGKILVGGDIDHLAGQPRLHLGRLKADGTLDAGFNPGADRWVNCFAVQADGKILVGGQFTTLGGAQRSGLARLHLDGSLDATLSSTFRGNNSGIDSSSNFRVHTLATQPDGKVLLGGEFFDLNGLSRTNLARLNADGTADTLASSGVGFSRPGSANWVSSIVAQTNGVVVSGLFSTADGLSRTNLARLKFDGSVDTTFAPLIEGTAKCIAAQADGKLLVSSSFWMPNRQDVGARITRLNHNGTTDSTFDVVANSLIDFVVVQADGMVLTGGMFTQIGGQPRQGIARLHPNGTVDATFNPGVAGRASCLSLQPDGKILVGGVFTSVGDQARTNLARLHTDGSVELGFNTGTTAMALMRSQGVGTIAIQTDGKIIVGGGFDKLGGQLRQLIGRLNPDGTLDTLFNPGPTNLGPYSSGYVSSIALQSDGKMIVGGNFVTMGGLGRTNLCRLSSGEDARQSLHVNPAGHAITWLRSGTAPEVEQVGFEKSLDGTNYVPIGNATRIVGGWQLSGNSLSTGQMFYVRTRGRSVIGNASSLIESVAQFYLIPPAHITSVGKAANGTFQFAFTNSTGASYTVLATTNLASPTVNWENLGPPVAVSNGLYQFTDPAAINHARRFYQLRSP